MATRNRVEKFTFLYDRDRMKGLLSNVRLYSYSEAAEEVAENAAPAPPVTRREPAAATSTSCSLCQTVFESVAEQRQHFKLDWHRYNLKQSLAGRDPTSQEEFERRLEEIEEDEDNEISASDDSSESEEESAAPSQELLHGARLHFVSEAGTVFSVAKAVLLHPRTRTIPAEADLVTLMEAAPRRLTWAVLMLGGGHFAGAVFRGTKDGVETAVHKTFHAYTVRAKQGGGQSAADNKSGSSHPKSAGASLRRYNEMSLQQHIQDIMEEWAEHFKMCQLIFYRATSGNKKVLFGAKGSVIEKNDERLRTIPFQTRRATFKEVKRIHEMLCRVEILGNVSDVKNVVIKDVNKLEKSPKKKPHRSKSREDPVRPLPVPEICDEDEDNETSEELIMVTEQVSTLGLQEFDSSIQSKKSGRKNKNKKPAVISKIEVTDEDETSDDGVLKRGSLQTKLQNDLLTAVKSGDNQMLQNLIASVDTMDANVTVTELVNYQFGESKTTPLHLASKNNQKTIIWTLLLHGADPAVRDKQKKVAYMMAESKDTRNVFRKFMGEFPDRYDYKSGMVPPPLSQEEEAQKQAKQNEKKKAQRQAKREQEKLRKEEDKKKKEEKEEKERFLNLSDREKRAIAAERRLQNSSSATSITRQRCFGCGADITGKTPFEYSDNKFCSVACVKKHRQQL